MKIFLVCALSTPKGEVYPLVSPSALWRHVLYRTAWPSKTLTRIPGQQPATLIRRGLITLLSLGETAVLILLSDNVMYQILSVFISDKLFSVVLKSTILIPQKIVKIALSAATLATSTGKRHRQRCWGDVCLQSQVTAATPQSHVGCSEETPFQDGLATAALWLQHRIRSQGLVKCRQLGPFLAFPIQPLWKSLT